MSESQYYPPLPSSFNGKSHYQSPPMPEEAYEASVYMPPLPPPDMSEAPPLPADTANHHSTVVYGNDASVNVKRTNSTKWGDSTKRIHIGGIHAPLPASMNTTQLVLYLIQSRLEEIDRKLRVGDVVPPERDRSPSPPPTYDAQGRRTNTRELRYRKKLEEERTRAVQVMTRYNPSFKVDVDPTKRPGNMGAYVEKVWIPAQEFPHVNFIGLLIGPRGNELKKMEKESGAKISIRGKGSLKEGRKQDPASLQGADEELHAYITADSEDKVSLAVSIINRIIEEAVNVPESENPLKKQQLKELALLNGTLREDQNEICSNCGAVGHRKYDCTELKNFTASLLCKLCGGGGHLSKDCLFRNDANVLEQSKEKDNLLSKEYQNFMKSLQQQQPLPISQDLASPKLQNMPDESVVAQNAPPSAEASSGSVNTSEAAPTLNLTSNDPTEITKAYYDYFIMYYGYDSTTAASMASYYTQHYLTSLNQ